MDHVTVGGQINEYARVFIWLVTMLGKHRSYLAFYLPGYFREETIHES